MGVKFDGIRKEVRIEDIIAAEGPRRPQASVAQRHFRHAFVLVVEDAESPDADAIRKVQQVRTNWRAFFNIQVGTRATVATELVKMLHLSTWPAAGVVAGLPGSGRVTISEARDTDLAVSLRLDDAIAAIPASVTIPAGELFAEFEIRGRRTGPATLTAVATEPGFDRAVTRLYVAESVDGLKLERLHFDNLRGLAGAKVPWPVDYRVRDENRLPYSGIELSFSQGIPGAEPIPSAMTDSDGRGARGVAACPAAGNAGAQGLPEGRSRDGGADPGQGGRRGADPCSGGSRETRPAASAPLRDADSPQAAWSRSMESALPRKRRTRTRFWRLGIAHFPSCSTASASMLGECRPRWSGCLRPKLRSSFRLNSKGPRSRWESRHCMREATPSRFH